MEKELTLTVNGTALKFTVTAAAYEQLQNEMDPHSKVAPGKNFLFRCVHSDSRDTLREMLSTIPGLTLQLVGSVVEEFVPDIEIAVGK